MSAQATTDMKSAAEIIHDLGIGSSDIAPIMRRSPFAGPWDVWARKKNLIAAPEHLSDGQFWGKALERPIAYIVAERMNWRIEWCDRRIYHPSRPWQYASPDALILEEPPTFRPEGWDGRQILEIKNVGLWQAGEWDREAANEDGVPEHYWIQVTWQMSATGIRTAWIAALIGGNDLRVYRIGFDPWLEEILVEEGEKFWRMHLMTDTPPPIEPSRAADEYLRRRFPKERADVRRATADEMQLLEEYVGVRTALAPLEAEREKLELQLKESIGEAEGLDSPLGRLTWKRARDASHTDWRKLSKDLLACYSDDDRKEKIREHTEIVEGSRRLLWKAA